MFFSALKRVFKQPLYWVIGVAVSVIVFLISVFQANLNLVEAVFMSSQVGLSYKLHLLWTLIQGLGTSILPLAAFNTIVISVLFGTNVSMLVYMVIRNKTAPIKVRGKGFVSSIGGVVSGIIGLGCAACGSLILTPIIASLGAAGVLGFLPLKGSEFGLAGIFLLCISIYILAKKINDPLVCPVN